MYSRHSPVRNPRSKGVKIKNVLQVCLLIAVCFWLIFQLKRSHDKKKEFDDTKISLSRDEIVNFGRKDLQPKIVEETPKEIEILEEDQEDSKHEVDEDQEQGDEKIEDEKDDSNGGGGDDEIDENELEKSEVEVDREEVVDPTDESEENLTENNGGSVDDHDEEDGHHTNEAREEHYKADDASSAVTHDGQSQSQTLGSENGKKNETFDNPNGQNLENNLENAINEESLSNTTVIQETASESVDGPPANTTVVQETASESVNGPPSNTTVIQETASESAIESVDGPPSNTTATTSEWNQAQTVTDSEKQPLTQVTEGPANSTFISEESKSDENESKTEVETEESLESYESKTEDETVDLLHLEEKEVRTDLDTLPEIESEGGNSEDTAVE